MALKQLAAASLVVAIRASQVPVEQCMDGECVSGENVLMALRPPKLMSSSVSSTCEDQWDNRACHDQFGNEECDTCGNRIAALASGGWSDIPCDPKKTYKNINDWYKGRSATAGDCKHACFEAHRKEWCQHSEFSTDNGGTCKLYACAPACASQEVVTGMNAWYGNRNARKSDCDHMCGQKAWCKRGQFSTASGGTCNLYPCSGGDMEARAAVGEQFTDECGACAAAKPPADFDDGEYDLVWEDKFNGNGAVDPTKWTAVEKGGGHYNDELQYYSNRTKNAWVSDGTLKIRALREDYKDHKYTSAKLETKVAWTYGKFHVKARLNQGSARGTWPALWMMPKDKVYGYWPRSGEIDIMEHVGYQPGKVHATVHTEAYNHRLKNQKGGHTRVNQNEWHTYKVDWKPDSIAFSIDDRGPYNVFRKESDSSAKWPLNKDFYLILNMAVGGSWGGVQGVDEWSFKGNGQIMEVDWVKVYQKRG